MEEICRGKSDELSYLGHIRNVTFKLRDFSGLCRRGLSIGQH